MFASVIKSTLKCTRIYEADVKADNIFSTKIIGGIMVDFTL